jgi:hypothetical protein
LAGAGVTRLGFSRALSLRWVGFFPTLSPGGYSSAGFCPHAEKVLPGPSPFAGRFSWVLSLILGAALQICKNCFQIQHTIFMLTRIHALTQLRRLKFRKKYKKFLLFCKFLCSTVKSELRPPNQTSTTYEQLSLIGSVHTEQLWKKLFDTEIIVKIMVVLECVMDRCVKKYFYCLFQYFKNWSNFGVASKVQNGGDKQYKEFFCSNFWLTMKDLNAKYYLEMVSNLKFIVIFLL